MYENIVYFLVRFWTSKTDPIMKTITLTLPEFYEMWHDEITAPAGGSFNLILRELREQFPFFHNERLSTGKHAALFAGHRPDLIRIRPALEITVRIFRRGFLGDTFNTYASFKRFPVESQSGMWIFS